jgi:hypothetical protein
MKRNAGSSESTSCSSSQSICRSWANDIRVGQAARLHQYPLDSNINSGHVKNPCFPYASRKFATEKVTSVKIEANLIEPSAFLPQRNKCLVEQELTSKVKATSENIMDFADSHKTKGKTAIACISTMFFMVDFSNLCINMDTIITTICSNDEPQPILCQILLNFNTIVNNPDWVRWSENVGLMPSLHWYCFSFLKQIFNCFANFATDFGNRSIMSEACLITKLNMSAMLCALIVLKTFCSQINLHQATMTAITAMPGSVTAYTVIPWNNTQVCGPGKDGRNFLADGASCSNSNTISTPKQCNRCKRDPTTPDMNEDNSFVCQKQKKPHHGVKVDTATKEKKNWECSTSGMRPSTLWTFSPRTCLKSFA